MSAPADLRKALQLEVVTLAWMMVEAAASLWAGWTAGSVLLLAFGLDSVIELLSASVLFWRLEREARARPGEEALIETIERRAASVAGYLLFALAGYIVVQAGYGLLYWRYEETSWIGVAVAVIAALAMPTLARAKIRVADRIGSRALRADAVETLTCGYLAWVLLVGLLAKAALRWWWLDGVAALALVPFIVKEAREARSGECCSPSCDRADAAAREGQP